MATITLDAKLAIPNRSQRTNVNIVWKLTTSSSNRWRPIPPPSIPQQTWT